MQAMLNFCYLHIIKTLYQDKIIQVFRLCQSLKDIDSIWVILKKSKNWREKKEKRNLDILQKRYMRTTNTKYVGKINLLLWSYTGLL